MRELLASRVNRGAVGADNNREQEGQGVGKGRVGPTCRSGLVGPLPLVSLPPSPRLKSGLDIAAVPTDDATEQDIQRGGTMACM